MHQLRREKHELASAVLHNVRHGRHHSYEQLQKVQEVLVQARKEVEAILFE